MTNIGLLYSHPRMIKQIKRHIKGYTTLNWNQVYSISMTVPECTIILSGPDFMEELGRFAFKDVYPVGWEKDWELEEAEKKPKKKWWKFG